MASDSPADSHTHPLRGPLPWAAALLVAHLVVPLSCGELFPFTDAALFIDAPRVYCDYKVEAADGRPIEPDEVGLGRYYFGLRGYSKAHPKPTPGARPRPETLARFGRVPTEAAIRRTVRRHLADGETVHVTRRTVGPKPDGSVGVVSTASWLVSENRASTHADEPAGGEAR